MLFEVCPNIIRSGYLSLIYIEALTEADKIYFPTVKELVSSFTRSRLLEDSLSKKPVQQTVDKLAIEKSSYFSNSNKSVPEGNIDSSQDRNIQSSLF
jgi:hypothetical protein